MIKVPLMAAIALATATLSPLPAQAEPYAYSPAYQYGYAPNNCCELAPYLVYGRAYSPAPRIRYRYVDYRNSHRWGFWGERGAYYVYR